MVERYEISVSLTTRILTVFRQVQHLVLSDVPAAKTFQDKGITPPLLKSISIRTYRIGSRDHDLLTRFFHINSRLKESFTNVTRLELNMVGDYPLISVGLLPLLAQQLEHVSFSEVENISPVITPATVVIPILPKLKVFEILRKQTTRTRYTQSSVWFRPNIRLDFESERDGVKLDYQRQFPALWKLVVRAVPEYVPVSCTDFYTWPDETFHFAATMLFLYENFLAEGLEPCETLRNLDISIPTGEVERKKMRPRCWSCNNTKFCKFWGCVEDFVNPYERISAVFPNLEYHVVEMRRRNERAADIKKFKELAEKLGIFDGNDFSRVVGLEN